MLRLGLLSLVLALSVFLGSCGQGGGGNSAEDDAAADGNGVPPVVGFQLVSEGGGLVGVSALTSFACRDDAFFVSVRAGQSSGIHKLSLEAPESGWVHIYPQEAFLETTSDRLIAAFPPGES